MALCERRRHLEVVSAPGQVHRALQLDRVRDVAEDLPLLWSCGAAGPPTQHEPMTKRFEAQCMSLLSVLGGSEQHIEWAVPEQQRVPVLGLA